MPARVGLHGSCSDAMHAPVLRPGTARHGPARPSATHRLMVGLWAPQFWHLPPVGWRLKKSPIVSIIASSVWAVMAAGLRGPMPARRREAAAHRPCVCSMQA